MFLKLIKPFFQLYVLKNNVPISANLSVTDRCNFRCGHCKIPERNLTELPKEKIFAVVDELKKGGAVKISLCGGEPLIRDDIGEIIDYIKARGIMVNLVSNGVLVRKKIDQIKNLDFIVLSYDGSPEAQEDVRGEKAHNIVLDAIDAAKEKGLKVFIVTVLTKNNLNEVETILDLAEEKDFGCEIHPVYSWSLSKGSVKHLLPEKKDMDITVEKLKKIKKTKKGKHLVFSQATLDYLAEWPKFKKQKCWAGNAYVYVDTDGKMYACNHMIQKKEGIPLLENGIREAMNKLEKLPCKGCWCLPNIEYNYMCSFNPSALWNFYKMSKAIKS